MNEKSNKTAVEWLFQKLPTIDKYDPYYSDIIKQVKEMEKQQIIDAYDAGLFDGSMDDINDRMHKQYYNETYGK